MSTFTTRPRGSHRVLLAIALALASVATLRAASTQASAQPTPDVATHGAYLVTGAGQCADCHGANLAGAPLHIPGPPGVPWAKTVPSLRGLHMFATDAEAVRFFMTATLPDGSTALRPMPHYNFERDDATAIVTYLRGLN